MSLVVEPKPGFLNDLRCFQPKGLSEMPLYKLKGLNLPESVLCIELPGVFGRGVVAGLLGGDAMDRAIL